MKETVIIVLGIAMGCLAGVYMTQVQQSNLPPHLQNETATSQDETALAPEAANPETQADPEVAIGSVMAPEAASDGPMFISTSTILGRPTPSVRAPASRGSGGYMPPPIQAPPRRVVPSGQRC